MSEIFVWRMDSSIKRIKAEVGRVLENDFRMELNTKESILDGYFSEGFLPEWYYYSNTPDTIAHHIYMLTHFLNANTDMVSQAGSDGNSITYFVNVGRDFPGRLARIIEQNGEMEIVSYDSETAKAGMRIVTIKKRGPETIAHSGEENIQTQKMLDSVLQYGEEKKYVFTEDFIRSLPAAYIREEVASAGSLKRILRHLDLFEKAVSGTNPCVILSETENETRISLSLQNPDRSMILEVLNYFKVKNINLRRSYYDLVESEKYSVGIMSLYIPRNIDITGIEEHLIKVLSIHSIEKKAGEEFDQKIEKMIRMLSSGDKDGKLVEAVDMMKQLANENLVPGKEKLHFYLNSITDFLEASKITGLYDSVPALGVLLGFKSFDEFFVSCNRNNKMVNFPGYRIKHTDFRGPAKGGLRIDPIVNFGEVAALSFMMSWKCARSRILFGGAKGGLMINPRQFDVNSIDFFDTLSNFGRSLFLVTGPMKDVPAGDVGCGAAEIGHMFEGFKSALRDLALMVYGAKNNVSMIGDRIISIEEARQMLMESFSIDFNDRKILGQLAVDQEYLELVVAAQITGKPRMGIETRNGATGRGMCYATLALITNLYLEGKWNISGELSDSDIELLSKVSKINEQEILTKNGYDILTVQEGDILHNRIYPMMMKDKKVVVQGSGKVGGSILKELKHYGVNIIAVSDAGGAVIGEYLDPDELLDAVEKSRKNEDAKTRASVVNANKNVKNRILGSVEGSAILELDCDILYPSALENAVTEKNAEKIKAMIEVCGSNGTNSSIAEKILKEKGVYVVYDFLANGGGVTASYFEWLRNLSQRFKYEAEVIYRKKFDISVMDPYIMPEFKDRIKEILMKDECPAITCQWNDLMRDIMFSALNEDYRTATSKNISLKDAGFVYSQFRVLAAAYAQMPTDEQDRIFSSLSGDSVALLDKFLEHPEIQLIKKNRNI